jgi:hypothetical protein
MKLSADSWHRKYLEFAYGEYFVKSELNHSLCPYFWALLGAITFFPTIGLIRGVEKILPIEHKSLAHLSPFGLLLAVLGLSVSWWLPLVIIGIIAVTLGLIGLVELIRDRKEPKPKKQKKARGQSMIMEFIKAKKNKYCPRIEWIE